MERLDRADELGRLLALHERRGGELAVVTGRRRVGKTRLLVEWTERTGGAYFVADQSSPAVQRRYLGIAVATRMPGFDALRRKVTRVLFAAKTRGCVDALGPADVFA